MTKLRLLAQRVAAIEQRLEKLERKKPTSQWGEVMERERKEKLLSRLEEKRNRMYEHNGFKHTDKRRGQVWTDYQEIRKRIADLEEELCRD